MSLTATSRTSLVETAIMQLREQITAGHWPVNTRIPTEDRLAAMLAISRNTVREAVRVLVHSGMLEARQGDGTYVRANVDPAEVLRCVERASLRDHLEVRRALEVEAARLAALRGTKADIERIRLALFRRGERPAGIAPPDFIERDADFHLRVVEASHNPALQEVYRYFWASIHRTIERTETDATIPEPSLAHHRAVFEAIRAGDAEAAGRAAGALLDPVIVALDGSGEP